MKLTTLAEFRDLSRHSTFVPVCKEIMADLLTPVSAFLKIAEHSDYSFLLESVEGGEHVARYSFLGKDPFLVLRSREGATVIERAGVTTESNEPFLGTLERLMVDLRSPAVADLPRFTGGAVGFLGYGAGQPQDPPAAPPDGAGDAAAFLLFDTVLAFDHVQHRILLIANARIGAEDDPEALYHFACAKVQFLERELERSLSHASGGRPEPPTLRSSLGRESFEALAVRARAACSDGDLRHVVLSRRFDAEVAADPFTVYRALRHQNPSPYMYFIRMGSTAIVGASPEMLVRVEGRHVEMHPNAGSRPRGETEKDDLALAESLRSSERERAAHVALVDQGRRELDGVCEYGTVRVPRNMEIDRYSHVMQLVSTVEGQLASGHDRFDALSACLPAGTVTGVPKAEAMDLIARLEPEARGVFAGAIGYLDFAGNLDFCTAIRTIVMRGPRASVQAGARIGPDADPADAFGATQAEADAMLRALALAHEGL